MENEERLDAVERRVMELHGMLSLLMGASDKKEADAGQEQGPACPLPPEKREITEQAIKDYVTKRKSSHIGTEVEKQIVKKL